VRIQLATSQVKLELNQMCLKILKPMIKTFILSHSCTPLIQVSVLPHNDIPCNLQYAAFTTPHGLKCLNCNIPRVLNPKTASNVKVIFAMIYPQRNPPPPSAIALCCGTRSLPLKMLLWPLFMTVELCKYLRAVFKHNKHFETLEAWKAFQQESSISVQMFALVLHSKRIPGSNVVCTCSPVWVFLEVLQFPAMLT